MGLFDRLFGTRTPANAAPSPEEAVLVHIDSSELSADILEEYDLSTLEDQLIEVIAQGELGEFDGNEVEVGGPGATLYMYGPDAERLFRGVEEVLRSYPLTAHATVVIRKGGPGASQREVLL